MTPILSSLRKPRYAATDYPPPPDVDDMAPEAAAMTRNVTRMLENVHDALHAGDKTAVQGAVRELNMSLPRLRRLSKITLYGWLALSGAYTVLTVLTPPTDVFGIVTACVVFPLHVYINWLNISRWRATGLTGGKAYFFTRSWLKNCPPAPPAGAPEVLLAVHGKVLHALLDVLVAESPVVGEYAALTQAAHYGDRPPQMPGRSPRIGDDDAQ